MLVNGIANATIVKRLLSTTANLLTLSLAHHSNAGYALVLSSSRTLSPELGPVVQSHILYTSSNSSMVIDLQVLQFALSGAASAYIGYKGLTGSVATIRAVGHIAGTAEDHGDLVAQHVVFGGALVGVPKRNIQGEHVMQINNASLGGKAGVIQLGGRGVTTRIYGAQCKDASGTSRLVVHDTGLSCAGTFAHQGNVSVNGVVDCASVNAIGVDVGQSGINSTNGNTLTFNGADLETTGTVFADAFAATSDRRCKEKLKKLDAAECLRLVSRMSAYTYELTSKPGKKRSGLLAQDLLAIAPHLVGVVGARQGEHYTVNYADLTAYIVAAVSQLRWYTRCLAAAVFVILALVLFLVRPIHLRPSR